MYRTYHNSCPRPRRSEECKVKYDRAHIPVSILGQKSVVNPVPNQEKAQFKLPTASGLSQVFKVHSHTGNYWLIWLSIIAA